MINKHDFKHSVNMSSNIAELYWTIQDCAGQYRTIKDYTGLYWTKQDYSLYIEGYRTIQDYT